MATVTNDFSHYDIPAEEWWREDGKLYTLSQLNPGRFQYFDRVVPAWDGLTVLDVGCGGGFTCEFLAKRGARVYGIDATKGAAEAAKAHAEQSGLAIDYRHGVGEQLPYDDNMFDVVTCVDVLEHVSDLGQVVREIARVLKPSGIFCFDTINRTLLSRIVVVWFMENVAKVIPKGVHDWHLFVKPKELANHMLTAGFSDISMAGFLFMGVDQKTGEGRVRFTKSMPMMYIGTARRV